jgi:chromosome segregation protein
MKLQSLRLHGFKSFPDRTLLEFRDGVTAIVGSNGCGKSNIADSIRWVLGEQRASAVRGAKMDEVIFQGTARRRPLNFAEVSLLFDNASGRIPVPQTELEVSRKVFREGGSEYAINRTPCRLRDVHGLLRDTGLGANAYSIIEATMIDVMLSDRAEERRALFEEAAGIGKYKDSRQAAARRLEAADADLRRLDDVIAEVETKVRSLSRQKRKAEKHQELQRLRLDLEVAIATAELVVLEEALRRDSASREALEVQERAAAAERGAAEAMLEERRIEAADLGRRRTQLSARLDDVRRRIDERERAILVARERRTHSQLRQGQLAEERLAVQERVRVLDESIEDARLERTRLAEHVKAARERAAVESEENQEIRAALAAARMSTDTASEQARTLAREIATSEGERAAAERQGQEARERHSQLRTELDRLRLELAQMSDQTELWETQADDIRAQVDAAIRAAEDAEGELRILRAREERARSEVRAAEDRVSTLAAQVAARENLERGYEGFAPAVTAIMAARERFPGVHGPLADALRENVTEDRATAVEAYLGPLLHAVIVEDLATARAVRRWFYEEWSEGGSLLLLPLDALEAPNPDGPNGGGNWVHVLLAGLTRAEGDPLAAFAPGSARVGPRGEVVDARGIIRLVATPDEQGILSRRARLARMRRQLTKASAERDARYREREELREALSAGEDSARDLEEKRLGAEARLRGLELDAAAHRDRRLRLQEERDRAETRLAELAAASADAAEKLEQLGCRLAQLTQSVGDSAAIEADARTRLAELETRWDSAREAEAELRVDLARLEGDFRELERRLSAAERDRQSALGRIEGIDVEEGEIASGLESLTLISEEAGAEIERLFAERDVDSGALALLDGRLAEVDSELAEIGERARAARKRESDGAEERHRLDLEIAEARSKSERVRERLEAEWGRPWAVLAAEAAPPGDGDIDAWRRDLRETSEQLTGLGPVNMLAVEEHTEEQGRLEFLLSQRADLVAARDNLTTAIREINKTACEVFETTFEAVRINFRRTFHSLFQGGECDIWLTDPSDPLESPVEIQASPLGKRTQRIHLLSGGERTLTALALLFALYLVKPSPFCVLDEVDAPLDETNVGRFIQLLQDFKPETQFIVITHHPRTMEAADWVYGVTMEEPGVSSIVGVELLGAWVDGKESEMANQSGIVGQL